jgi:2-dehydropantoate 2-reductase
MKISVLGAGAVGSMLGGLIKWHMPQIHVQLVVRGKHGESILRHGTVELEGPWGRRAVRIAASRHAAAIADSEFVLLTVKSQSTEEAMRGARPYLGKAALISIQNGINQDELASYVTPGKLVIGTTAMNVATTAPGRVRLELHGMTLLGHDERRSASKVLRGAVALLRHTGLRVAGHPNVRGVQYSKLGLNALGAASCLSDSDLVSGALCDPSWRRYVGWPILQECIDTFRAAGLRLAKIPGRPTLDRLRRLLRLMDIPALGAVVSQTARWLHHGRPIVFSLSQDLRSGQPTEIDFINGHVVCLAASLGIDAPFNRCVVEMVRELEREGGGRFYSRDEVIDRFRRIAAPAMQPV